MKKALLSLCFAYSCFASLGQQIFYDDFSQQGAGWDLNSSGYGGNLWVVNDAYGDGSLMGFCTDNQTNAPGGYYLHPTDVNNSLGQYCTMDGPFYDASSSSDVDAYSPIINTQGYFNVTLSFWWMCTGSTSSYGRAYYSIDGGNTWKQMGSKFYNITAWQQDSFTYASVKGDFDDQADLRFKFNWKNGSTGSDPPFCIDEFELHANMPELVLAAFNQTSFCGGDTLSLSFSCNDSFSATNKFIAELSDATGVFTNATQIGSVTQAAGTGSVLCTFPSLSGTGYRVRIRATDPKTVTADNGVDLTLNQTPIITLKTSAIQGCVGSLIQLKASGGSNYAWSQNVTTIGNDSAIIYLWQNETVDVTGQGSGSCPGKGSISLTAFPKPQVNLGADQQVCAGTSVLLQAGGTYASYLWSTGETTSQILAKQPGIYWVSVLDNNGCNTIDSISIGWNALPKPGLGTDTTICEGTSLTLNPGLGFTSYQWSTGASSPTINVNQSGLYAVEVSNSSGCKNSDSIWVNVQPLPKATFSFSNIQAGTFRFTALENGYTYFWSFGDGANDSSQIATHTYIADNTYQVELTVTDAYGCSFTSNKNVTVTKSGIVLICDQVFTGQIFPNPFKQELSVQVPDVKNGLYQFKFIAMDGRTTYLNYTFSNGLFQLEVPAQMPSGLYVVELIRDGILVGQQKVIRIE